jgi:methionyl-tRNA formyltransferase
MTLRLAFMGTPDFAVPALDALLRRGHAIAAVYCQPPRPAGRGQRVQPSPVQRFAEARGLAVRTPRTLRDAEEQTAFAALGLDAAVVAAYGVILPKPILVAPRLGCLNIHASLLPRWRGAAPIQRAILAGDAETGVSIMLMDEGMDTGPVLALRRAPISAHDTTATLEARLAALGAELLVETIPGSVAGTIEPQPQDDRAATYCRPVRKADGEIDWARPAAALERQVRAMQPWPTATTRWEGRQLRILRARAAPDGPGAERGGEAGARGGGGGRAGTEGTAGGALEPPKDGGGSSQAGPADPGQVVPMGRGAAVGTGDGLLVLEQVQLEGRPVVPITAFLNGYRGFIGARLGS